MNVNSDHDCRAITCAVYCRMECGWSRRDGLCLLGEQTSESEAADRLGDCAAPTTQAAATSDGSKSSSSTLPAVVGALAGAAALVALFFLVRHFGFSGSDADLGAAGVHFANPAYNTSAVDTNNNASSTAFNDGELYNDLPSVPAAGGDGDDTYLGVESIDSGGRAGSGALASNGYLNLAVNSERGGGESNGANEGFYDNDFPDAHGSATTAESAYDLGHPDAATDV